MALEAYGIVTAALGLLPLCRGKLPLKVSTSPPRKPVITSLINSTDGLDMIKEVFNASKTLELAVGRVELQKDVSKPPFPKPAQF
jgi:hypothetical protein